MSDQTVTTLIIDADTSAVGSQFVPAMDKAGASAEDATSKAKAAALAIAGVSAASLAAIAGVRGFVDYVGAQSKTLADIADHAAIAGVSLKEFQQNLFAARASGVTEKDFTAGFDKIASNLEDANRGATQFGKLFEANGLSIKNANGELKTAKQAIADLAGLMQQATPSQQQAIARIAGVSQSWVGFLKQGVDGIEAQKKAAEELGLIIDDATIKKAQEFSKQWHTATAIWDQQFKASLASIMPLLIQLAEKAVDLINGIGSFVSDISRLVTPTEKMNKSQLNDQLESLYKFRDTIEEIERTGQQQGVSEGILQKALGLPPGSSLKDVDAEIAKIAARIDDMARPRVFVTTPPAGVNLPAIGGGGTDRNSLKTEEERIEKHIALMKADAEAVGMTEAAHAGLRAEAGLYAAAQRAGFTDLEQFAVKFFKIRENVEAATKELAEARVEASIKFGRDTAFLSQEDVQIAKQLKGLFPDVATALKSPQAEAMRLNNTLQLVKSSAETFASGFTKDLLAGVPAVKALETGLKNLASSLLDNAVKKLVDQALSGMASALSGAAAGAGEAATMTAGATTAAGMLTAAGVSVAAEMVAGATAAAGTLGLTIPTAAASLPVAGAVTGVEVAAGGAAAGAALVAGGAAAGAALWGPIALIVAAVAALGLSSFLGGDDDSAAQEFQKAQDNWKTMSDDVGGFNSNGNTEKRPANDNESERREQAA